MKTKAVRTSWKEKLAGKIDPELGREIDIYEMQLALRKEGKLDERVFTETRLRRGVYGQRYDDGLRNDGSERTPIGYLEGTTKGAGTLWDAPGMQRIKLPWGGLTPDQLDVIAELAEEYADGILHVTTRQDIQLHFVHIDDTPDLMRRLAAVAISTREACGNSVRNVTACPIAGVCTTEAFDVTPYAEAVARFLLGHEDVQAFGRKFKISFSGCEAESCGLARMHDIGVIAKLADGASDRRGFQIYVGGGLGAVPHEAKLFADFLEEEELLPMVQAMCRVFARLGEKKNRGKARMKFLVEKLGIEELRRLVFEERATLVFDPKWTAFLPRAHAHVETPKRATEPLVQIARASDSAFERWERANVMLQKQAGFVLVTVVLPLGDLSSDQARGLADVARRYVGDHLRATVDQNLVLRFVREQDLRSLFEELSALGLADPTAGTIADVVACPGTDTCRLGISSSRGLANVLREKLMQKSLDESVLGLQIKVSGCFNGCSQHHLADIGFYGVSRKHADGIVPCFQVVLGGETENNAGSFGLAIGAVPAKNIPSVIDRLTEMYTRGKLGGESFGKFVERTGRRAVKEKIEDLMVVPGVSEDASFYSDFGDSRRYTLDDHRGGEGAGVSLPAVALGLAEAEREVFEAQLALQRGETVGSLRGAYRAMLGAARTLLKTQLVDAPKHSNAIVAEFKARFFDNEKFFDPSARGRFAVYFFRAHEESASEPEEVSAETARRRIEEAQLFVEAAYACWQRISTEKQEVKS